MAMLAVGEQEQLQLRWGSLSCRAAALAQAETILAQQEETSGAPQPVVTGDADLGGLRFHLVIADEQAKLDVNRIQNDLGSGVLMETLQKVQATRRDALAVDLSPHADATKGGRLYSSLEQVLAVRHPSQLLQAGQEPESISSDLTCYGVAVNLARVKPSVLAVALQGVLNDSDVAKILALRAKQKSITLADVYTALKLPQSRQAKLSGRVADRSRCHSVWVIAYGRSRPWYSFSAAEDGPDGSEWSFTWP